MSTAQVFPIHRHSDVTSRNNYQVSIKQNEAIAQVTRSSLYSSKTSTSLQRI
jgi:hypothetical protein